MKPSDFSALSPGRMTKIRTDQGEIWSYLPNDLPPKLDPSWGLTGLNSEADRRLAELGGIARNLVNPHLLINPFTRREAVYSSRIEGTEATLTELAQFEAEGRPKTARMDVREVYNYVAALEHGLKELPKLPLSLRLIRDLHAKLMRGVRGEEKTPGEFRKGQVHIGPPGSRINEATFVPPPPNEMIQSMGALERYLHAPSELPPLIRMSLIHYQFEAIHPFYDGNGRVGRLLITLEMCAEKVLPLPLLYLSSFFDRHRADYYQHLLNVSRNGDWQGWIEFFLRGIIAQSNDALYRSKKLLELAEAYRIQAERASKSVELLHVVDMLFVTPVITAKRVATKQKVTFATAQRNVERLEKLGIIREVTGKRRNRMYVASQILQVVEDPQTEDQLELPLVNPQDRTTPIE